MTAANVTKLTSIQLPDITINEINIYDFVSSFSLLIYGKNYDMKGKFALRQDEREVSSRLTISAPGVRLWRLVKLPPRLMVQNNGSPGETRSNAWRKIFKVLPYDSTLSRRAVCVEHPQTCEAYSIQGRTRSLYIVSICWGVNKG